jgi:EmrB/QacA subfamily drug resistance transporter
MILYEIICYVFDVRPQRPGANVTETALPSSDRTAHADESDQIAQADESDQTVQADERRKWMALVVLCVGMLMIILDSTIVNVALPSIQDDLGFSQSNLAWVVNAYLIAFGGLLLLAGRVGDLIGRKSVFMVGLAIFTAASLVCGVAQSQEVLIGARFVQGVGGALTSGVILGIIVTMFPNPREQAKAIGVYSFVASAGASIGLLAGGLLTQGINWHWIFFVNLPIGLATALLAVRLVDRDAGIGLRRGADLLGAVLVTAALMLGVYTILEAGDYGWASLHTLGLGAVALALLGAFLVRQARASTPLVPLRIFRSRNVMGANVIQMLMVAGLFGMFFLSVLYLQRVLGYDAIETGVAFLPVSVLIGVLSLGFSARLNTRFGARATLIPGLLLLVGALALFARVPVDGNYLVDLLPSMVMFGIGAGLSFPSLMTLAMSGATRSDAGLASGLVNTSLQVGGALGLAILATLATSRTEDLLASGEPAASALTDGYQLAFIVAAGLVVAAVVIALTVLRSERAAAADVEAQGEVGDAEPAYSEGA